MTFTEFVQSYDTPHSVILLEGKRHVPASDAPKLVALGKLLATRMKHAIFRSGNAKGADELFCEGVGLIDPLRIELITPYESHRKQARKNLSYRSLDTISIASEPEVVYHSSHQKNNKRLIDRYAQGERDAAAIKGAYLIRDTVKVVGANGIPSANAAIFYDDLENPRSGGTGHTIEVCDRVGVVNVDQSVWMTWL